MQHRKSMLLGAVSLGMILSTGALPGSAAADTPSSVVLANTCFSCHGTDGHSAGAMPTLNGKPAKLIEIALKAFRDGKKESTVMMRIAKGFDDAEIKALAEYFAKNPN
jgi:sulfide dehydrogenase cytochrome subunit